MLHSARILSSVLFSVVTLQQPKLLCSTLLGVACHTTSRCRRHRAFQVALLATNPMEHGNAKSER